MKRQLIISSIVLLLASSFAAKAQMSTLKDAYKPYFSVGVAVNLRNISDPTQIALIKRNFNSMTAENVMKPQLVQPHQGEFNWDDADRIANFCRENGIKLRGHCLMWYKQIGDWFFKDENGKYVSREVLYDRMRTHIYAVVNRYKDIVYCWDVVNETIQMFSQIVEHIHFTELDVRLTDGNEKFPQWGDVTLDEKDLKRQEEYYVALFKVFRKNKKYLDTVTFWNLADADSWLGRKNGPLLFDFDFRPKQVYRSVVNFTD